MLYGIKKLIQWLKGVFSEPDGTGSASRVLGAAVVATMLFCIVFVCVKTSTLPENLGDAALVIGAGFSGYAANKFSGAFKRDGKD